MKYIQTKKLGYDREHVLVLPIDQKISEKSDLFKAQLTANPEILSASKSYKTPVNIEGGYVMSKDPESKDAMTVKANPIDEDYVKTNSLQLIAGADLNKQDMLDVAAADDGKGYYHFIVNESAAKTLGYTPAEAIGKRLYLDASRPGEIKAVIKDFHFASLHTAVAPLVLFPYNYGNVMMVKTSGKNLSQTIDFISKKWQEIAPHRPFEFKFMDEEYNKLYASEQQTGKVFTVFSVIAIVRACLGLFGLSAYSVQQRKKEIGVRKVLGASSAGISLLLANQFIRLVAVAFVIAAPVAWLVAEKWLQDFAYRTDVPLYIFVIAGLCITGIALFTVSFQAVRASLSNPVKALRSE